jgi:hypothetical protein
MTESNEYRRRRDERPAEGPAQTDEDALASLPPGGEPKPDDSRGDVDRAMPYEGDPAPSRMEPQPFDGDD